MDQDRDFGKTSSRFLPCSSDERTDADRRLPQTEKRTKQCPEGRPKERRRLLRSRGSIESPQTPRTSLETEPDRRRP
uniref:Uncharacterized protein n=1 Tax=Chromera velia CCMP2878 TaxID=1169474 RepID=A0A0G4HE35_9ALVE|eukprot:Cvel_26638.t1-p1 / transcript=Cvel_26638.t1 / gene=Cvel_26638 / organism=Chromera_velia_CCMP2878 / gene_product=hypothetical protein / transcript_product=hypothetical protein / location=Cvel_scaffold3202:6307-7048(+) / protein_length=76 / sequence_SO=supercontig / SO=protein_coding / is_pseudo=false